MSHRSLHHWIVALALIVGIAIMTLPKMAGAQIAQSGSDGFYTTNSTSTSTSSTDAATGITTTTTNSSTSYPRDRFTTRGDRSRDYWRDRNYGDRTTDIDARYPYDNTNGRNRSDVDAVRSGFDDPRNPWDGRYTNDNPRNSAEGRGSNDTVNSMRGEPNNAYRPGRYGTYSVRNR